MDETQAHLEKHEAECAVRYEQLQGWIKALDKRMWRLEAMLMLSTASVIGIAAIFLTRI